MMYFLKNTYRKLKKRIKLFLSINWLKTLYFNFKMFPFSVAKKLPVYIYENVKFTSLKGEIIIESPIKSGMIGIGQRFEKMTRSIGVAEISIIGKLVFKGYAFFGKDCLVYVGMNAYCEFGNMSGIASRGQIICTEQIVLDANARIGDECKVLDTDFHQMINVETGEKYNMVSPVKIGKYNFIGSRTTIAKGTMTPDCCVVASNSLCNKDYTSLENNVLIGGIPAKLLKTNFSRDWEGEREMLEKSLIIKW